MKVISDFSLKQYQYPTCVREVMWFTAYSIYCYWLAERPIQDMFSSTVIDVFASRQTLKHISVRIERKMSSILSLSERRKLYLNYHDLILFF